MSMIALAAALLISGQATTPPQRATSDLTRNLNSAPPSAVTPPSANAAPAQVPARAPTATQPAPQSPASTPRPTLPHIGGAPQTQPATPATTAAPSVPATPAPAALDAAAIAALPFGIELPTGLTITPARAGADASIYRVQRGDQTLLMIYAGPSSQFPIYDGEMVRAGGRASVVVTEGGRRLAMEHLFQRATAPKEIHVWIASVTGADRDLAERIGQSIDAR
jgi:hypothetical protein